MSKVAVLVEGQTEEAFVKEVLIDHFASMHIALVPTILETSRAASGRKFKGGVSSYAKVRKDVIGLLGDSSAVVVTTMLDYYGLPTDFPGFSERPINNVRAQVTHLEHAFAADVSDTRFKPYLMTHEFEAFLFSNPQLTSELMALSPAEKERYQRDLAAILDAFGDPELINTQLPPSKRILAICERYQKVLYGSVISGVIGIQALRSRCRRFAAWLTELEAFAPPRS